MGGAWTGVDVSRSGGCAAAGIGCLATGVMVGFWWYVDWGGGDEGSIGTEYIDAVEDIAHPGQYVKDWGLG